ncbi:electron transport complex subunit RsxG [Alteromonadaceae bacterium BrNp21-10]|nr:electron transport complex subunit RsxG [Alteromonadaceae bacterium BrNp21-10]
MINVVSRNGLILAAFALVSTGLIAVTQYYAAPVIAVQQQRHLLKTLDAIIPPELYDNALQHDCIDITSLEWLGRKQPQRIFRATKNGQPVGMAIETTAPNGYNGKIDLLVGIIGNNTVSGVRVLQHSETPGLGDKIDLAVDDWILSFNNKTFEPGLGHHWAVKKDGGQFDQFTGATITPRAVVGAVKKAMTFYQQQQQHWFAMDNMCEVPQ